MLARLRAVLRDEKSIEEFGLCGNIDVWRRFVAKARGRWFGRCGTCEERTCGFWLLEEFATFRFNRIEPWRRFGDARSELLRKVWGYENADSVDTRTVDIHITKLRKKIEDDPSHPKLLVTFRGEGYQMRSAPECDK